MQRAPTHVLLGVLLVAFATLLFEVCLTRILSVTLWYHFGFLVIALAMLGSTAAAVCCFLFGRRLLGEGHESRLGWFAALFAVAAPLAIFCHFHTPLESYTVGSAKFFAALGVDLLLLFLAFFAAGMCITISLTKYVASLSTVYFFDLLGAAAGPLVFAWLLGPFSAPALVFAASAAASAGSYLFFPRSAGPIPKLAAAAITVAVGILFVVNEGLGVLQVSRVKAYRGGHIQMAEPAKVFEKWSPVARVAVFEPQKTSGGGERMHVTNDAGAPTNLHRYDGDVAKLQSLRRHPRQIAHHLKPDADVLIIGSAGGRDVQAALAFGQRQITAVEINPVTVELVAKRFADYIGGVFEDPRVTFHQAEGRNFLTTTEAAFDLIQVTMIDSWAGSTAGAYVFNESNLYTTDAIADFVSHLKPDGILSISRYYHRHEALRLANIMLTQLERMHVPDAHRRIAVVIERGGRTRATVLLKNGVFTPQDTQSLMEAAQTTGNIVVYAPHAQDEHLLQTEYAREFRTIVHPASHGASREQVVRSFPCDISAVSDDRPFFFFMDRFREGLRLGGDEYVARRMALPLLYGMLAFLGAACLLTVILPLFLARKSNDGRIPFRIRSLAYFGCLGVGFMVIELGLIHKFTVLLGYPTYSFVTVVTTLLLSGGLGSWLSGTPKIKGSQRMLCVLLGVIAAAVVACAWCFHQVHALRVLSIAWRTTCVVAIIAPLGLAMGMCFPAGMEVLRRLHPGIVPWGWGVNGVCGVFGCALTLVIALNVGLTACLLVGGGCYLVALACMATIRVPNAPGNSCAAKVATRASRTRLALAGDSR